MRVVMAEKLDWNSEGGTSRAPVHEEKLGDTRLVIEMVEIPAGGHLAPHYHEKRREFHSVAASGGAQVQIGERVFRPIAGQVFEREPGEILAITNDTLHPLQLLVTRIGYDPDDIHWVEKEA